MKTRITLYARELHLINMALDTEHEVMWKRIEKIRAKTPAGVDEDADEEVDQLCCLRDEIGPLQKVIMAAIERIPKEK